MVWSCQMFFSLVMFFFWISLHLLHMILVNALACQMLDALWKAKHVVENGPFCWKSSGVLHTRSCNVFFFGLQWSSSLQEDLNSLL